MIRVSFALGVIALPLCAADLTGRWLGTYVSGDVRLPVAIELAKEGTRVSGASGTRQDFLTPLEDVQLTGNTLTFGLRMGASSRTARFRGAVQGDRISGDLSADPPGSKGVIELRRAGAAARFPAAAAMLSNSDPSSSTDEFDKPESLKEWKTLSEAEGWPDRTGSTDINRTRPGSLYIVPQSGAWWAGYHGVYFFKEVTGNFVITSRLQVTGRDGGEPSKIWTISGLLLRAAPDRTVARDQRKENWIYLMTGRGPREQRVVDAKSTLEDQNAWDITPAQAGWYELRIARLGPVFVEMVRESGKDWVIRKRICREDLPQTLQAGINVTSDFTLSAQMKAADYNARLYPGRSDPDSATEFDYVRFGRIPEKPDAVARIAGRPVVAASDADLLALLR